MYSIGTNQPSEDSSKIQGATKYKDTVKNRGSSSTESVEKMHARIREEVRQLFEGKGVAPVFSKDFKDFVQLHCGAKIAGTAFEGSMDKDKYDYWKEVVEYARGQGHIKPEEAEAILKPIEDGLEYYKRLEETAYATHYQGQGQLSNEQIEAMHELVTSKLEGSSGSFYLPAGWVTMAKEPGHFAILKFSLEGEEVKITVLNRGAGLQYHTAPVQEGAKLKYDCRSMTASIPLEEFKNERGKNFIKRVAGLECGYVEDLKRVGPAAIDEVLDRLRPMGDEDLYGLIALSGIKQETLPYDPFYMTTPQRSGNCAEACLHLAFKDAYRHYRQEHGISGNHDAIEFRRMFFKLKEESLINSFKTFFEDAKKDPDVRLLLQDAVNQYVIRSSKLQSFLTEEEKIKAAKISKYVRKKMAQLDGGAPVTLQLPLLRGKEGLTSASSIPLPTIESRGELRVDGDYFTTSRSRELSLQIRENIAPDRLTSYLKENLKIAAARIKEGADPVGTFTQIHELISSLPDGMVEVAGKNIWVSSEKEAQERFDTLYQLTRLAIDCAKEAEVTKGAGGREKSVPLIDREKLMVIGYCTYDIAATLAPQIGELKIPKEYGFALHTEEFVPSDRKEDKYSGRLNRTPAPKAFTDPRTMAVIRQVEENFEKRNGERNKKEQLKGLIFSGEVKNSDSPEAKYIERLYGTYAFAALKAKNLMLGHAASFIEPVAGTYLTAAKRDLQQKEQPSGYYIPDLFRTQQLPDRYFQMLDLVSLTHMKKGSELTLPGSTAVEYGLDISEIPLTFPLSITQSKPKKRYENEVYTKTEPKQEPRGGLLPESPEVGRFAKYLKLPEDAQLELEGIASIPSSSPQLAMGWAKAHVEQLSNPAVRDRVEKLLFSYKILDERIQESPDDTFNQARDFVRQLILYYRERPRDTEAYLWALRIGDLLEGHLRNNLPADKRSFNWVDTGKLLDELTERSSRMTSEQRYHIAEARLQHSLFYPPATNKEYRDFLRELFIVRFLRTKEAAVTLSDYRVEEAIIKHYPEALRQLSKATPPEKTDLARELLKLQSLNILLPGRTKSWEFNLENGEFTDGNHSIFFDAGKLFINKKNVVPLNTAISSQKRYTDYFGSKSFVGKVENGYFRHVSDPFRLVLGEVMVGNRKSLALQYIEREDNGHWYRYIEDPRDTFQALNPPEWLLAGAYTFWLSCDGVKPERLLIRDKASDTIVHSYTKEEGLRRYDALAGKATETRILHLYNEQTKGSLAEAWKERLQEFETPQHTVVEAVGREGGNVEIQKICFPRLQLEFEAKEMRVKGKGLTTALACRQLAGFYLKDPQPEIFLSLKGGLVLENERGQTKVILPAHPLSPKKGKDKSVGATTLVARNLDKLLDLGVKDPYFVYTGTSEAPLQRAESPQGALYLSILYRTEKRYDKAIDFLKSSTTPYSNRLLDWQIADMVVEVPDYSPEGVTYDLHLHLHMKEHAEKFDTGSGEKGSQKNEEIVALKRHVEHYEAHMEQQENIYRNNISNIEADIYQIPDKLRLTAKEAERLKFEPNKKSEVGKIFGSDKKIVEEVPLMKFSFYTKSMDRKGNANIITEEVAKLFNDSQLQLFNEGAKRKLIPPAVIQQVLKGGGVTGEESRLAVLRQNLSEAVPESKAVVDKMVETIRKVVDPLKDSVAEYEPGKLRLFFRGDHDATAYLFKNYTALLTGVCSDSAERRLETITDLLFLSRSQQLPLTPYALLLLETLFFAATDPEKYRAGSLNDILGAMAEQMMAVKPEEESGDKGAVSEFPRPSSISPLPFKLQIAPPQVDVEYTRERKGTVHAPRVFTTLPVGVTRDRELSFKEESLKRREIYNENFTATEKPARELPQELFSVKDRQQEGLSPLARKQMDGYNEGVKEIARGERYSYEYVGGNTPKGFRNQLLIGEQYEAQQVAELKKSLIAAANKEPEGMAAAELQKLKMLQEAGQRRLVEFPDILGAFLKQDGGVLQTINPALTRGDIRKLFDNMLELYLHEAERLQLSEAIDILDKEPVDMSTASMEECQQQVGELLARRRCYDPREYPLLAVYEGTTGKILRKDQFDAIAWTIEGVRGGNAEDAVRLLQAFAGFGKTKVLVTIVSMMLAQEGFLPVVANTTNLYDFGKRDLERALQQAFLQNMELFEVRVGDPKLSMSRLEALSSYLKEWREDKKCLLLTPESWHVLNMHYKDAFITGDIAPFTLLQGILSELKDKGFVVADEAHLICNSLQEAIKAIGRAKPLLPDEIELYQQNYKTLMNDSRIVPLINLKNDEESVVTESNLSKVKDAMIDAAVEFELFRGKVDPANLKALFRSPLEVSKIPEWLSRLRKEEPEFANLIALQHGFIQSVMAHVLALRGGIDYGDSIHKGDLTTAPKHDKQETTARFSDEYITLALTIQHTQQQGISKKGIGQLLTYLHNSHERERRWQKVPGPTRAEEQMKALFSDNRPPITIQELDFKDLHQQEELYQRLHRSENAISFFLEEMALQQIRLFDGKITSTPAEFLSGFKGGLCLTATPGALETLPVVLTRNVKNNRLDRPSEAETIAAMLEERNKKVVTVSSYNDPEKFFSELIAQKKTPEERLAFLKNLTYLIDRAGGFRSVDNKDVVAAYMKVAKEAHKNGTISVTKREGEGSQVIFTMADGTEVPLDGSNLIEAMKQKGVDPNLLAQCFYYYSIMETTGVDWPMAKTETVGLLTVGEEQTATDTIQALKRNRAACQENQTVEWVLSEKMVEVIGGKGKEALTPKEIVTWMINNEAKEQEKKLWLRFQQGIETIFVEHVKEKIKGSKSPFEDPHYERYANFFRKIATAKPIDRYYLPPAQESLEAKQQLLNEMILNIYQGKLGYDDKEWLQLDPQGRKDLQLLVTQTTTLLEKITGSIGELSAEAVQEQEQIQEQVQQQEQNMELEVLRGNQEISPRIERYESVDYSITNKDFISTKLLTEPQPAQGNKQKNHRFFGDWLQTAVKGRMKAKAPDAPLPKSLEDEAAQKQWREAFPLIFSTNFFVAGGYLRPVKSLLVEMEIDSRTKLPSYKFVALSTEGFDHYRQELLKGKGQPGKRYLLVGKDGTVIQKGKGGLHPNDQEVEALLESPQLEKAINAALLLEGKIRDPEALAEIIDALGDDVVTTALQVVHGQQLGIFKPDRERVREAKRLATPEGRALHIQHAAIQRLSRMALPAPKLPMLSERGAPGQNPLVGRRVYKEAAATTTRPQPQQRSMWGFFSRLNPSAMDPGSFEG